MPTGSSRLVARSAAAAALSFFCASAVFADTTITVTPTSLQGWHSTDVTGGGTVGITGHTPRSGNGSQEFDSPGSNGKATYQLGGNLLTNNYGTLSNLATLSYDYFRTSSDGTTTLFPSLRLLVYNPTTLRSGTLIYEPVYNGGAAATNTWINSGNIVSNDGNFWLRARPNLFSPAINYYTPSGNGTSLSTWRSGTTFTSSPALNGSTYIYGFELGIGSGWAGTYEGFADNLRVGFGTGSVTTYNFETANVAAVPEPGPVAVTGTMLAGVAGLVLKSRRRKSIQA